MMKQESGYKKEKKKEKAGKEERRKPMGRVLRGKVRDEKSRG